MRRSEYFKYDIFKAVAVLTDIYSIKIFKKFILNKVFNANLKYIDEENVIDKNIESVPEYLKLQKIKYMQHNEFLKNKNMCIYDIGAYFGDTAEYFESIGFKTSNIICFEIDKENFDKIPGRFKKFNVGIDDKNGICNYIKTKKYTFLIDSKNNRLPNAKVNKLDTLITKYNLPKPDLLKIITCSHQYNILRGAKEIIHKFKPLIYTEYNGTFESMVQVLHLLNDFNYSVHLDVYSNSESEPSLYCYPIKQTKNFITNDEYVLFKKIQFHKYLKNNLK